MTQAIALTTRESYFCIMKWKEIYKDSNDWNEKTILGTLSFAVMVVVMALDLVTGTFGSNLVINESVYNSFVIVTLGCFGIAGLEKFAKSGGDK